MRHHLLASGRRKVVALSSRRRHSVAAAARAHEVLIHVVTQTSQAQQRSRDANANTRFPTRAQAATATATRDADGAVLEGHVGVGDDGEHGILRRPLGRNPEVHLPRARGRDVDDLVPVRGIRPVELRAAHGCHDLERTGRDAGDGEIDAFPLLG
jgi:hypothetical protein